MSTNHPGNNTFKKGAFLRSVNSRKRAEVVLDIGQPIKIMVLPVRIPQGPLILTMEKRVTNKLGLKN